MKLYLHSGTNQSKINWIESKIYSIMNSGKIFLRASIEWGGNLWCFNFNVCILWYRGINSINWSHPISVNSPRDKSNVDIFEVNNSKSLSSVDSTKSASTKSSVEKLCGNPKYLSFGKWSVFDNKVTLKKNVSKGCFKGDRDLQYRLFSMVVAMDSHVRHNRAITQVFLTFGMWIQPIRWWYLLWLSQLFRL